MRRAEAAALDAADLAVVCSYDDAATLERLRARPAGARIAVVANGVDLERFAPSHAPCRNRVLFFGSLDYEPNVDGLVWFVREAWPRVRAAVPGATLAVVGRRPTVEVRELANVPGVTVQADVAEAPPCYAASDVVVVAVRIGSGTRLKALEAMASGRPVVGTRVGLEGLHLEHAAPPSPAITVDTAAELADGVIGLLRNPTEAAGRGQSGRRHVEARFGWTHLAEAMAAELAAEAARARAAR
jgi:glycosyltransferase involved in cell wall biosynthesis